MTLAEIRDWLKTKIDCPQWYSGKIDGSQEQCIGLYGIQGPKGNIAIGGLCNTSYATKSISILVHWSKNSDIAEKKAQEVYNALFDQDGIIGAKRVIQFDMRTSEPISVGTDASGFYEYVIETTIYYER